MSRRPVTGVLRQRLAHNLKFAREVRQLTQEELAEAADMSRTYVSEIEYLKRNATIDVLEKLSKALGIDVLALLGPTDNTDALLVQDRPRRSAPERRR